MKFIKQIVYFSRIRVSKQLENIVIGSYLEMGKIILFGATCGNLRTFVNILNIIIQHIL